MRSPDVKTRCYLERSHPVAVMPSRVQDNIDEQWSKKNVGHVKYTSPRYSSSSTVGEAFCGLNLARRNKNTRRLLAKCAPFEDGGSEYEALKVRKDQSRAKLR